MLSVQDEGIGMAADRMTRLNARLADLDPESAYDQEGEEGLGLGLYVVARLARRHGVRVQLREQKQGGTAAVVVVPRTLLAAAPASAAPAAGPAHSGTGTYSLPGANAEVNSNVLHVRAKSDDVDPLVALAERAVRKSQATQMPAPHTPAGQTTDASSVPESPAETTMELLLPTAGRSRPHSPAAAADGEHTPQVPPAPHDEGRTSGAGGHIPAQGEAETVHERAPEGEDQLTTKGLPKRTPKISTPTHAPRQRTGSVDAEALRRRLGGFRRGAQAGYRDIKAEIAEESTGGTVEEASS
jgi:hypothetical protein